MKKFLCIGLVLIMLMSVCLFAVGCDMSTTTDEETEAETVQTEEQNKLGDFAVTIESARLAKDYEGKDVVIVKYTFENLNDEDGDSFMWAMDDKVFQNGVGLNKSYFVDDSANYSSDNQSKEIRKGASIEVEVAYELNDTTTPIEVEVSELISFTDAKVTKTFNLQ